MIKLFFIGLVQVRVILFFFSIRLFIDTTRKSIFNSISTLFACYIFRRPRYSVKVEPSYGNEMRAVVRIAYRKQCILIV